MQGIQCLKIHTTRLATAANALIVTCASNPMQKMKHLHQLQSQFKETYAWLNEHKAELDNAACLCLPCVKQIQRNHHREFTPRWLAKPPVPPKLCNVQHCQGTVHAQTSLMSAAALETCLKAKVNDQSTGKMETAKWKAPDRMGSTSEYCQVQIIH